jgi:hypothetical protein
LFTGILEILGGLFLLLVGLGKVRISNDAASDAAFVKKWGLLFMIVGPALAAVGVLHVAGM